MKHHNEHLNTAARKRYEQERDERKDGKVKRATQWGGQPSHRQRRSEAKHQLKQLKD